MRGTTPWAPLLADEPARCQGVVVIGTVQGDLHDIGKNLVSMMLSSAGLKVHDLGVDVSPQGFVAAVERHAPSVLAMSALLTSTMPSMGATVAALSAAGLRARTRVIVGGAPVSQAWAQQIGADGFSQDAMGAVAEVRRLLAAAGGD
ncbi:MAG: cobalamin-dependent protein [Pseudomonadota bacterium]